MKKIVVFLLLLALSLSTISLFLNLKGVELFGKKDEIIDDSSDESTDEPGGPVEPPTDESTDESEDPVDPPTDQPTDEPEQPSEEPEKPVELVDGWNLVTTLSTLPGEEGVSIPSSITASVVELKKFEVTEAAFIAVELAENSETPLYLFKRNEDGSLKIENSNTTYGATYMFLAPGTYYAGVFDSEQMVTVWIHQGDFSEYGYTELSTNVRAGEWPSSMEKANYYEFTPTSGSCLIKVVFDQPYVGPAHGEKVATMLFNDGEYNRNIIYNDGEGTIVFQCYGKAGKLLQLFADSGDIVSIYEAPFSNTERFPSSFLTK